MRFGVVVFPGTWSDRDFGVALRESLEQDVRYVWHKERDLSGVDCVVLPGGFAYGDYLRTGAIASLSPVMESVVTYAERGGLVLGKLQWLPGPVRGRSAPRRPSPQRPPRVPLNEWTHLRVENADTPFTRACQRGDALGMPVSHGEGRYFADPKELVDLELNGQVVFRYANADGVPTAEANPNGSFNNIAGIVNKRGNVLGMMPHPERASSTLLGGTDGLRILHSILGERSAV